MDAFFWLLALASWILCVIFWIFIKDFFNPLRKVPGTAMRDPFFGVIGYVLMRNGRIISNLMEELRLYGPIRRCYLFMGEIRIMVSDPEWIKYILVSNAKNYTRGSYAGVEFIREVIGDSGLILISGDRHRRLRRLANPAFRLSQLRSFVPIFQKCVERLIQRWKDSGMKEVGLDLSNTTLDAIGLAAFGYDFQSHSDSDSQSIYTSAIRHLTRGDLSLAAVLPFYRQMNRVLMLLSKLTGTICLKSYSYTNTMHELVRRVARERKELLRSDPETRVGGNLLDLTLAGKESGTLSVQELQDLVMTFMLAGHETSSVALSWTFLLLAQHKSVQDQCREEVDSLIYEQESLTWENVKDLKYLTATINETLRLFPPVPYVNRCTIQEDKLGDFTIPKGTDILIVILEMHRNPSIWGSDAHQFRPERFLEMEEASPQKSAFMPFGDGIHKCIGYQFALTEIAVVLASLLAKFSFDMMDGLQFHEKASITMKPYPPLRLRVQHRD